MNTYGEAWAYWYREVARDLYLREGKRELGDIDLVMSHPSGVQLLVEAKNMHFPCLCISSLCLTQSSISARRS
jgi:hypothetical protein